MTAIFRGVNLTLMIGPMEPVAVPLEVIDALDSVKVINKATGVSGFELVFKMDIQFPLQTIFLLASGIPIPLVRVVVAVTVNGQNSVLIDGVMTDHTVSPDAKDGITTLTIKGEDLTRVMDYIDFSGIPFPCMPPEAQVAVCVAKYAMFGIIPMIVPSVLIDITIPTIQILRQQGTDLAHVMRLADMVGYVFYLVPGPAIGSSVAYWGPQVKWARCNRPSLSMPMRQAMWSLFRSVSATRMPPCRSWSSRSPSPRHHPDPHPQHQPADPTAGGNGADPEAFSHYQRDSQTAPRAGIAYRAGQERPGGRCGDGHRDTGRGALRPGPGGAGAWSACAGRGWPSTGCGTSPALLRAQTRRVQAGFHLVANGLISTLPTVSV